MRKLVIIAALSISQLLISGCATMAENRAALASMQGELHQLVLAHQNVSQTARPITILGHNVSRPNSAGGVDFTVSFQNTSGKIIKYARFTVTAINAVGDPVGCSVRGPGPATANLTGPVMPMAIENTGSWWSCLWYNNTAAFARLDKVEVDFMDGTSQTVEGDALRAIQIRPENNEFSAGIQQAKRVYFKNGSLWIDQSRFWSASHRY